MRLTKAIFQTVCVFTMCYLIFPVVSLNIWESVEERLSSRENNKRTCVPPCKVFHSWCKNNGKCRERLPDCAWYCECPANCEGIFCEKIITKTNNEEKVEIKVELIKEKKKTESAFDRLQLHAALANILKKKKEKAAEPPELKEKVKDTTIKNDTTVLCLSENLKNKTGHSNSIKPTNATTEATVTKQNSSTAPSTPKIPHTSEKMSATTEKIVVEANSSTDHSSSPISPLLLHHVNTTTGTTYTKVTSTSTRSSTPKLPVESLPAKTTTGANTSAKLLNSPVSPLVPSQSDSVISYTTPIVSSTTRNEQHSTMAYDSTLPSSKSYTSTTTVYAAGKTNATDAYTVETSSSAATTEAFPTTTAGLSPIVNNKTTAKAGSKTEAVTPTTVEPTTDLKVHKNISTPTTEVVTSTVASTYTTSSIANTPEPTSSVKTDNSSTVESTEIVTTMLVSPTSIHTLESVVKSTDSTAEKAGQAVSISATKTGAGIKHTSQPDSSSAGDKATASNVDPPTTSSSEIIITTAKSQDATIDPLKNIIDSLIVHVKPAGENNIIAAKDKKSKIEILPNNETVQNPSKTVNVLTTTSLPLQTTLKYAANVRQQTMTTDASAIANNKTTKIYHTTESRSTTPSAQNVDKIEINKSTAKIENHNFTTLKNEIANNSKSDDSSSSTPAEVTNSSLTRLLVNENTTQTIKIDVKTTKLKSSSLKYDITTLTEPSTNQDIVDSTTQTIPQKATTPSIGSSSSSMTTIDIKSKQTEKAMGTTLPQAMMKSVTVTSIEENTRSPTLTDRDSTTSPNTTLPNINITTGNKIFAGKGILEGNIATSTQPESTPASTISTSEGSAKNEFLSSKASVMQQNVRTKNTSNISKPAETENEAERIPSNGNEGQEYKIDPPEKHASLKDLGVVQESLKDNIANIVKSVNLIDGEHILDKNTESESSVSSLAGDNLGTSGVVSGKDQHNLS